MGAVMVDGQFSTLEEPSADEAVHIDAAQPIPAVVEEAVAALA
jgi:gluconate kinase